MDFLIPIRIDSVERIENLLSNIGYLTEHFHTNIYVLEASHTNNHLLEKILPKEVAYYFIEDLDPIFHRTKYINILAEKSFCNKIAIWDADEIIDYQQIIEAVTSLRNGEAEVAIPYDGRFYDTTEIVRSVYLELKDFGILYNNINKMLLPYGANMAGGAIFIQRKKFDYAGGEDENFYGWGVEDWNRIEKWKKYGYTIKKTDGPLFHLSHPRDINGRINSELQKRNAYNILRSTQTGNIEDIKERTHSKLTHVITKDKLQIGCGNCLLHGWINTDIKPCSDDVLYMDITRPFPFDDNSFRYVYSEHVCEHVSFDSFILALREILRILKPNGVFRIAMPSLDFLLNLYNNPNDKLNSQYIHWHNETFNPSNNNLKDFFPKDLAVLTINNFMHSWGHKFIYSKQMIEHSLKTIGFKSVKQCDIGKSNHMELRNLEQHGTQIPDWANKMETVIYEAEK